MGQSSTQRETMARGPGKAVPYPWVVVVVALGVQMGASLPTQALPVLYPFIQSELGLSRVQVGLISSALTAGGIATVLLGGWLADVVGPKRVMVVALASMAVLMAGFLMVYSLPAILVLALLIGSTEGPGYPVTTRVIMDWAPSQTLGLAMSLKQTGVPVAGAIAAAVLPGVALAAGWRMGAAVGGVPILFIAVLFLFLYRDAPRHSKAAPQTGFAGLTALSRNRGLVIASIWGFAFVSLQFIVLSYFVLFVVEELRASPVMAGGLLAVAQVSSCLSRMLWGIASDFVFRGRRIAVLAILGCLAAAGLVGVSLTCAGAPRAVLFLLAIVIGVTILSWHGVFTALIGETVGAGQAGTAVGAVSTGMRVSHVITPPLFGLLADMSGSYCLGWRVAAVVALLSTLALLGFGREPERR